MNKNIFVFLAVLVLCPTFYAQRQYKYWVKFKDKNGTPFSVNRPSEFLTQQSVSRRVIYDIPVVMSDVPVTPAYIQQVEAIDHSQVLYASKWMNGVAIAIDSSFTSYVFSELAKLNFVSDTFKVNLYKTKTRTPDSFESLTTFNQRPVTANAEVAANAFSHGGSYWQNHQLGVDCLHERGFRGQGMTIAVMDAGFGYVDTNPVFDSLHQRKGILGGRDFVSGGSNPYQGSLHGTAVMSCLAANNPGVILGSAPMANYWLFRTEAPEEALVEEYNWIRAAEFADSVGADIFTTSLGYTEFDDPKMNHTYATLNGRTAPMSIAATMAARKGILVFTAAGNERSSPWHFISVPGDADSVCTVGAVDSLGKDVIFSSVGPTSDGRIKPDLVARGAGTWIVGNLPTPMPGNGTSFATPVLAGAVACYWQAHRQYNNMRILRNIKNGASNRDNPNNFLGWGLPDLCPDQDFDFYAYNDPATSIISIDITESEMQSLSVQIVDLMGHVLLSENIGSTNRTITIHGATLADGIYIVKLNTSKGTKSKKIVKTSI